MTIKSVTIRKQEGNEYLIIPVVKGQDMREVLNFVRGKLNREALQFHYLRIGKAAPLLDELREKGNEYNIKWDQHEADNFGEYHFGLSYEEYDGALINLGINDENIASMRRQFWEQFVWKTEGRPLLTAIVYPDTQSFGSLSRSQLIEALSLVRLTDRPFELFEHGPNIAQDVFDWITSLSSVVHRIEREPEEDENVTTED